MIKDFVNTLTKEFNRNYDEEIAAQQRAYLRNKFEHFGLKTKQRREIQKPFLHKNYLPEKEDAKNIIRLLWAKPQRDFHYFGQELLYKYRRNIEEGDINLIEFMIVNKSWWDTVDFIATKLVGDYFMSFPEYRNEVISKWLDSHNIWLQRSALIFQLKYKKHLDQVFLGSTIKRLLGSDEFFINKAIGWVLREHSKTNPDWVIDFVAENKLHKLSRYEALRLIK